MILILDTAATDLWNWTIRSVDSRYAVLQPHLLGVAFKVIDESNLAHPLRSGFRFITPPTEVTISERASEFHGITLELLANHPVRGAIWPDIYTALTRTAPEIGNEPSLADMIDEANLIVAHNANYHRKIMDLSFVRSGLRMRDNVLWFCTMGKSAQFVRIPQTGRKGWKWPSLREAFEKFSNNPDLPRMGERPLATVDAVHTIYMGLSNSKESMP